jgi:arginine deiminase
MLAHIGEVIYIAADSGVRSMRAHVRAEWDPLRTVAIHRPGIEMFFGLLEPYASLYERAFSRYGARKEHQRLEQTLRDEFDVDVLPLKETMLDIADRQPEIRERLINIALGSIDYTGGTVQADLAERDFARNTELLDSGHFFNILLLHPTIDLNATEGTRAINLSITHEEPLSNLYYMRDQQAVTDKGIVLSRMAKPQRNRETEITGLFWEVLGAPVVHRTADPGTFEGGDFMPMRDFALIGLGDRTNRAGVDQLLESAVGFDEVAVVRQPGHPLIPGEMRDPMVDMHLDTYFNVASSSVAVGSEPLLKRARVEIYFREGEGEYAKEEKGETNLHDYMTGKGFDIIPITTLEQMAYASNFLCIRDGTILAVEVDRTVKAVLNSLAASAELDPGRYGRLLEQATRDYQMLRYEGQFFPHKKEVYMHDIDAYPIILENLTGGYGGAHCMTCTLHRS